MPKPDPKPPTPPARERAPARPDHHGTGVAHPDPRERPRWGRRLFRLVFFLLLLLVVLVVAGPKLLSTGPGTRLLLTQINSRVDGHLKIDDLTLAWFSGLDARGVRYASGDGGHTVTAGRIALADTSLWALATGDRDLGRVVVKDLHGVTIEHPREKPGSDGSQRPQDSPPAPAPEDDGAGALKGLAFDLEVDGLSWRYHAPDMQAVDLVSSALTLSLPGDGSTRLQVAGALTQGDASGRFDIDASAAGLVDREGRPQPGLADYTVAATAQQVPVDALSRFVSGRAANNPSVAPVLGSPQPLSLLLGEGTLSGEVRVAGTLDALDALLRVHTANLDADIALVGDGEAITSGEATSLSVEVSPEAAAAWLPEGGLVLDGTVTLEFAGPDIVIPLTDGAVDVAGVSMRGVVNSSDWSLTDAQGRRFALASPKLGVVAQPLGDELVAVLESQVTLTDPSDPGGDTASGDEDVAPMIARVKVLQLLSPTPMLTLDLNNAPTAVVERLYGGAGGLAAALGPVVQSVDGRLALSAGQARSGELSVNWDHDAAAPSAGALAVMPPVAFLLDESGVVSTQDGADFEMRLKVTPTLGDFWLGQVHPVLFDAQSSDRPVRIVVDGSTFACPLGSGALGRARIDASLDLGTVQFGENSLLARIVEWAGHAGEQAEFASAKVSLHNGELRYDQLALEVGNVHLRFQGAVNLIEQSLTEMSVRVPSESLVQVFQDLEDVVEPGDELVIPMRGALRDPEVDMESFRGEIVRLLSAAPRRELEQEMDDLFGRAREAVEDEVGEGGGEVVDELLRRVFGRRGRAQE